MLSLVVIVHLYWIVQMLYKIGVFSFSVWMDYFVCIPLFPANFLVHVRFFPCYEMFLFSYYGLWDIAQFLAAFSLQRVRRNSSQVIQHRWQG